MIDGFGPISSPNARVLVLGTIPSVASLAAGEYYAHPRNAFWPIIERLFADGRRLDYGRRCDLLRANGIALWDVLARAERPGSLDSAIVGETETPNDIPGFLEEHPDVHTVCFNGVKAEQLFRRHVAPGLPAHRCLTLHRLPSTSPAHASLDLAAKTEAWRVLIDMR